jgi:hypothetical protein
VAGSDGFKEAWPVATWEVLHRGPDFYYDDLERSYGDWHGFNQNVMFVITRASTGARLGC